LTAALELSASPMAIRLSGGPVLALRRARRLAEAAPLVWRLSAAEGAASLAREAGWLAGQQGNGQASSGPTGGGSSVGENSHTG